MLQKWLSIKLQLKKYLYDYSNFPSVKVLFIFFCAKYTTSLFVLGYDSFTLGVQ